MNWIANQVEYYLPVFIPLFLTVISVLAGVLTKRIKFAASDLLKIHSDVVLGLFSFVIWALVQYQQTGRVKINNQLELDFVRVVMLLFANIILLIAGYIVLNVNWEEKQFVMFPAIAKRAENWANGLLLAITAYAVFAPIQLARPLDPSRRATAFTVAIPYFDPTLARNVGASRWGGRRLCEIVTIVAPDPDAATTSALQSFRAGGRAQLLFDRTDGGVVSIDSAQILVARLVTRAAVQPD